MKNLEQRLRRLQYSIGEHGFVDSSISEAIDEIKRLTEALAIAERALKEYQKLDNWSLIDGDWQWWVHPEHEDGYTIAILALDEIRDARKDAP